MRREAIRLCRFACWTSHRRQFLREENVFVMMTSRIRSCEILRPLKVLILNLMPKKIETENQFRVCYRNPPARYSTTADRCPRVEEIPAEHLNNFYCNFDDICDQNFDGLIVTGAPPSGGI
ncbi:homoserine O-succinyltransferase [Salmonella enterica subsp. enterica]|nr:homoserine O-succinyltransferase [Salmonella enterica subsp. enterica]